MAPVARALAARCLAPHIMFTGQQRLEPGEFALDGFEYLALDCSGQADPHRHVQQVVAALAPHFSHLPDLVVIQGDTSSALGGFLAAQAAGISTAHVEAGLRTHDPNLPWPEEEYRVAIDARADLLFAPTQLAVANLRREGVSGLVALTGNTGIDALVHAMPKPAAEPRLNDGKRRLLVTCHRRESWTTGLRAVSDAIIELATDQRIRIDVLLHPNTFVARTMIAAMQGHSGIRLLPPCTHPQLLQKMCEVDLILSDSGGMQEEAPALGVPLLILRDITERPEAITSGNAILVGVNRDRIVAEVGRLLDDPEALASMAVPAFPFGDGRAAVRIAAIIEDWLRDRSAVAARAGGALRANGNSS